MALNLTKAKRELNTLNRKIARERRPQQLAELKRKKNELAEDIAHEEYMIQIRARTPSTSNTSRSSSRNKKVPGEQKNILFLAIIALLAFLAFVFFFG